MDALTRYTSFRDFVARTFSVTTQQAVDKALVFAQEKMEQYARYDGRPLLDHDVAVAEIVAREIGLGRNSTVAAILHDVMRIAVKEQPDTVDELTRTVKAEFGEQVLGIIVGLCKISNIKLKVSKEQADDFRDMIVSYSEDPRVILIKLADRLEVMRNLDIFPPEKRRKKSWESLNLYAQIAHKLGLYALKSELEDLALACVDPGSDRYADYRCDYELWDCENGIFLYLATSADSEIFQNDGLRVALTYAVDRDLLVENYYRDFARSATLPASPLFPYYSQTLADRYAYAPEKYAEAVSASGFSGYEVVFLVNSDDSLRLRVARKIAEMLEAGGLNVTMKELGTKAYTKALKNREFDIYLGQTRLSPTMDLTPFFATYGDLSWGGVNDLAAYSLSLQAIENHGNYFSLHKMVMDNGLLCPILFRSYAVYATRGLFSDLNPSRDNVFYYSLGKTLAQIRTTV